MIFLCLVMVTCVIFPDFNCSPGSQFLEIKLWILNSNQLKKISKFVWSCYPKMWLELWGVVNVSEHRNIGSRKNLWFPAKS